MRDHLDTGLPLDGRFNVFFRLTKVDANLRQVWGRATEEIPDKAREILDYKSSKPQFEKWSAEAKKRSDVPGIEPSLGNVREMHGETAAGKVIDIQFNDAEKAIDVGTYCADDGTWQKILKGVLTGFSIGGHYLRRWMDASNPKFVRYTADPVEISYVDVPAVPTATFAFIKADGGIEMKKVGEPVIDATTDVVVTDDLERQKLDVVRSGEQAKAVPVVADVARPENLIDGGRAVQPISQPKAEPVEKTDGPDWLKDLRGDLQRVAESLGQLASVQKLSIEERTRQESILKNVGDRIGIARRPESALVAPNGQADFNQYGDPANWLYPCDKAGHMAAVDAFNKGDELARYKLEESHVLGRRIARLASRFGDPYLYSPKDRKVRKQSEVKKMTEPNALMKVELDALMAQVQSEVDVAADKLGIDSAAFRLLLANALANVEQSATVGSVDTSTKEPTPPTGEQQDADVTALKAVAPATSGAGPEPSSSSPSAGSPSASGATAESSKTAATPTTGTAPSSDGTGGSGLAKPTAASTPDAYAAMAGKVDALAETVNKLLEKLGEKPAESMPGTTPVVAKADVAPVGDLATLLNSIARPEQDEDPVIKALTSGDRDAMMKAAQAAGSPENPDPKAVLEKAMKAGEDMLRPTFTGLMLARGWNSPEFLEQDAQ